MSESEAAQASQTAEGVNSRHISQLYILMAGVILVLFTALVGVVVTLTQSRIDAEANKQATYQSLRDQVKEQNDKIDRLTDELNRLQPSLQLP